MIDHEAIIRQQNLDQFLVEEAEYASEYGSFNDMDPLSNQDMLETFKEERYNYSYGEEEIQPRKGKAIQAVKLG